MTAWPFSDQFPFQSELTDSEPAGKENASGWDGTLAADGRNTVDIGFAGANDGAYPSRRGHPQRRAVRNHVFVPTASRRLMIFRG